MQRLSCHFSWPEFCDERRCFHQEFVYDVTMFAATCGFAWPDVIRAAAVARGVFPQLDGQSLLHFLSAMVLWFLIIYHIHVYTVLYVSYPLGLDVPKLLSLLRDALSESLPNLTSVHRHEFTQFLTDTCVTRQRLLQAAVGGAANMSIAQLHLEVQLPPTPSPLTQVMK